MVSNILKRIFYLSPNKKNFNNDVHFYNIALMKADYKQKLKYYELNNNYCNWSNLIEFVSGQNLNTLKNIDIMLLINTQ